MSLSESIIDQIDGATETRGRDSQLTEWGQRAEQLEGALHDIVFGADMMLQVATGAFASYAKEVKRIAQIALKAAP